MNCNEYREKFINEELTPEEKKKFMEHLKECEGCRAFVEKYKKTQSFMRIRTDYIPSEELREKIVSNVRLKKTVKRLYAVVLPTAAMVVVGIFLLGKPFINGQNLYQRVALKGIEMLRTTSSATASSATPSNAEVGEDYSYLVHIKNVSDQF